MWPAWALLAATASAAPKNIIVMVVDGGGYNTFAATSMYQGRWDPTQERPIGQVYTQDGWITVGKACWTLAADADSPPNPDRAYQGQQAWRAGGSEGTLRGPAGRMYPYQHQSVAWHAETKPDSAGTMTQMMTGVKTYNGAINYGIDGTPLTSFVELLPEERGVGVVTSVPISHATPAAAAGAHSASRRNYTQIAQEIFQGDRVDVWMGAGHPLFDDSNTPRQPPRFDYVGGPRTWAALHAPDSPWTTIDTTEDFEALAGTGPLPEGRVLGLAPVASTLQAGRAGLHPTTAPGEVPRNDGVPSLNTMTQGALRLLSAHHPDGFFLMVEAGAVDWAMHDNATGTMIEEMLDFQDTAASVVQWIEAHGGWADTLLLITADHDHLFGGPPTPQDPFPLVEDRGPGEIPAHTWLWYSHSNHLVPVYARGNGAQALLTLADEQDPRRGPYIQDTEIFDVLIEAWRLPDPR